MFQQPAGNFPSSQQQAFIPTQIPMQQFVEPRTQPQPQPQQQQTGDTHTQSTPNRPTLSFVDEGCRISFPPTTDNHAPCHNGNGPMAGSGGLGHLFGNLVAPLMMGTTISNLMGAAGQSQGARSGPTGIERLLHMVPTTNPAFKEIKELMVIRGENPLQCFDQKHLIEQWTSRKSDVDTILNAIAKKQDHLQGVDFKELSKKAPEEQGLFFLKSLLKHPDNVPNIQMLAYLKQNNFLKRVEPHTPTSDSARTPEASNSPRSNSPTIITGTDSGTETLEQTSAASGNQSDIEQAGKPGSRPEMEDVFDEEES
ncbi:hypothetical protein [Endozoicomonas elysicola]|nr:hypothetical protein [Endozoicomonas elysicola]